jgi:hypothetical protein
MIPLSRSGNNRHPQESGSALVRAIPLLLLLLYLAAVGGATLGYYHFGRTAFAFTNHGPIYAPYGNDTAILSLEGLGLPWSLIEYGHVWNMEGDPDIVLLILFCLINAGLLLAALPKQNSSDP